MVSQTSGQFESASASVISDNDPNHNALLEPPMGARPRTRSMDSVPRHGSGSAENGHRPSGGTLSSESHGIPLPVALAGQPRPTIQVPSSSQPNSAGQLLPSEEGAYGTANNTVASDSSTPEEINLPNLPGPPGRLFHPRSLPVHLLSLPGILRHKTQ